MIDLLHEKAGFAHQKDDQQNLEYSVFKRAEPSASAQAAF